MKTLRMLFAMARAEARLVLGQLVAITVIIGPVVIGGIGLTELSHSPRWMQTCVFVFIGLGELAMAIVWLRRVHHLAGTLPTYESVVRSGGFVMWQCSRDMHLLYPIRTLHDVNFFRRYVLASRLDTYLRTTSHQRLWERLLRRVPQQFVVYVVVHGSMTKLFDLARLAHMRRTLDYDRARWMIDTIGRVNAIYSA